MDMLAMMAASMMVTVLWKYGDDSIVVFLVMQ